MFLSFIVPVFNTEVIKLKRCFESIREVKTIHYECIVVDDGSKSNISDFCKKYCDDVNRFNFIRKENGGVSSARNIGIKNAKGDFIAFVDSDDIIESKYYSILPNSTNKYDLILSDLCLIDGNKKFYWKAINENTITIETLIRQIVEDGRINGPVAKLIRTEFIQRNSIYFDESMVSGEDAIFLMDILLKNPIVGYDDRVSYYYFREYKSGLKRIETNLDKYYSNMIVQHNKTLYCINNIVVTENERDRLFMKAYQNYLKTIFNGILDAVSIHLGMKSINKYISLSFENTELERINFNDFKSKMRIFILKSRCYFALYVISKLRKKYLSIKGLG